jgi:TonB family protein
MRRLGVNGSVEVAFVIDENGRVRDPVILRSSNPYFDRPSLDSILTWKFKPARQNGRPVATQVRQTLRYTVPAGQPAFVVRRGPNHNELPPELRWTQPPEVINSAYPVYPYEALVEKRGGSVLIAMIVDPTGQVIEARIEGDAPSDLAAATRAMAAMWEFTSGKAADGSNCGARVRINVAFKPDGSDAFPVTESASDILRQLAQPEPGIVEAAALDEAPRELTARKLPYPVGFRAAGLEGSAEIEFYIDRRGDVQLPRIISATHEDFGASAALAVACSRYEPPRKQGEVVVARMRRVVTFSLTD